MAVFFKKAFQDMKESVKSQHEVDKANIAAVKTESKAQWEEEKANGDPGGNAGSMLFSIGLGAISIKILNKTSRYKKISKHKQNFNIWVL